MGIFKRIKLWWKTTPATDKILYALSGVSTAAAIVSTYSSIRTRKEIADMSVTVKLYPGGKDDPDPIELPKETDPPVELPIEQETKPPVEAIPADTTSEKWEVWNPEWELKYKSESGYESVRLADALAILQDRDDGLLTEEQLDEAEARVEDLARQFAYLEGNEDEFRRRFPFLKHYTTIIYDNVEVKEA